MECFIQPKICYIVLFYYFYFQVLFNKLPSTMDHTNLPFGFALPAHAHPQIPPTANMLGAHPSTHPGPTSSPPQSVPGRRTPLGSVGLGGFYAQGLGIMQHGGAMISQDENRPDSGASANMEKSTNLHLAPSTSTSGGMTTASLGSMSGSGADKGGSAGGKQKNRQGKTVRLNINAR